MNAPTLTVAALLAEAGERDGFISRETLAQARELQAQGGVPLAALHFLHHAEEWTFREFCLRLGLPLDGKKQRSRARTLFAFLRETADTLSRMEPRQLRPLFTADEELPEVPRCEGCYRPAKGLCLDCEIETSPPAVAGSAG